ncbi:hypothetical protein EC957_010428 [Mortierella hygrophila]|uniref:Ubiquitin-like protease family profile domain-containing protein n=1 Tax=Mortierella hygrophila TaxID=979708 RepID=A0A9P6EWM5_9FUNG|nr:hypothetical protein EC957_010428 [Mortierella hygrophila]
MGSTLETKFDGAERCASSHLIYYRLEPFGIVSLFTARLLAQVIFTKRLAGRLIDLEAWITTVVKEDNPAFSTYLIEQLFKDKDYESKQFEPAYTKISVRKEIIYSICSISQLTDDAISFILLTLARCYGQDDKTLFMPPLNGQDWNYGKALIAKRTPTRMFSIIHMDGHWGVVFFDLHAHTIAFGDSLNRGVPLESIKAIVDWISMADDRTDRQAWDIALLNIQSFPVQQQSDSFSCGILAIRAIERRCNPYVDWKPHTSPQAQRIRFLRLLSNFSKIEDDMFFSAYWKHHTLIPYETHVDEVVELMQWELGRQAEAKQQWEAEWKRLQNEKAEEYCRRKTKQEQDEVLRRFHERKRAEETQMAESALKSDVAGQHKDAGKFEDPSNADKTLTPKKPIRPRPLRKAKVILCYGLQDGGDVVRW